MANRWRGFYCSAGVSRKTQELCLFTFMFRYLDLLTIQISIYNTLMKLFYIICTAACVYVLTSISNHKAAKTYKPEEDSVDHWRFVFLPCLVMGALTTICGSGWQNFSVPEFLWTVSLYLEANACLPQIVMFQKYRQVESLTGGSFILTLDQ